MRSAQARSASTRSDRNGPIRENPEPSSGAWQRHLLHQEYRPEHLTATGRQRCAADGTANGFASTVPTLERQLDSFGFPGQDCAHRLPQLLDREPDVEIHEMTPLDLAGAETPEVFGAMIPGKHLELRVDDDHRHLDSGQDRGEKGVGGIELVAAH